jgi:hypothetical protein
MIGMNKTGLKDWTFDYSDKADNIGRALQLLDAEKKNFEVESQLDTIYGIATTTAFYSKWGVPITIRTFIHPLDEHKMETDEWKVHACRDIGLKMRTADVMKILAWKYIIDKTQVHEKVVIDSAQAPHTTKAIKINSKKITKDTARLLFIVKLRYPFREDPIDLHSDIQIAIGANGKKYFKVALPMEVVLDNRTRRQICLLKV